MSAAPSIADSLPSPDNEMRLHPRQLRAPKSARGVATVGASPHADRRRRPPPHFSLVPTGRGTAAPILTSDAEDRTEIPPPSTGPGATRGIAAAGRWETRQSASGLKYRRRGLWGAMRERAVPHPARSARRKWGSPPHAAYPTGPDTGGRPSGRSLVNQRPWPETPRSARPASLPERPAPLPGGTCCGPGTTC